ncbi:GATA zinc finger domain-containing protein 14-like [Nilaparvata lugens]|uniref:GATA zinc finger domain-containing protein 14-like n=1 Tax=Nilaparvata lugens TaxID=108931 RepID=UPI00193D2A9D|nr:GATA zinc finger domain-containing protein 14-like [Nilaparvata lugens]
MKYLISALIGALFAICMVEGQRRPPNYSLDEMPRTSFSCRDKIVGGYYADPETDCQMFHVCVRVAGLGVQDFRFLCPNDTSFDQENQICDDWYNIDCEASTLFYSDNFDLYRISDGVPEFGPSRATPISLGPSSAPPIYSKPKQRPSHLPVNNAVSEDDDDTYLQKADTGDRRLHKDLLRGSSSGNFFANRNNGKEDNDDDDNTSSADFSKNKFGDAQAKKKTAKVAVRKLLTGKRPVNQATEQSTVASTTPVASTTVASVQQNNNFGGRQRYNTVQRARVTTPAPYVETSTAYNTNNNNFNNNNYNNNYNNNNYNSRNNNNNYNNYQTPTTAAPTSSVAYNNNFRSRGNVNFNTYQSNNNQENNNNYQETSSTTQATTVNNNNFNRNYNQNYNNNNNNYNNYQYQTSTANPFNYNYQSTNNNYQSTNNNNGAQQQGSTKFYTQQQNVQQSSTTSNYYQTQQQSTNNNNNNNYYQQQQYNNNNFNNNNYNAQSSSVASSAAYQQPTTYRTTSFNNNNNYQQNYNGNNNYNQQSTTFNYDKYYQTSTVAPRAFDKSTSYYTTTVAPHPSGFQNYYDKSSTSQAVNMYASLLSKFQLRKLDANSNYALYFETTRKVLLPGDRKQHQFRSVQLATVV